MPARPAWLRLLSGSCSSARSFAPRFLHAGLAVQRSAVHFARCDQLTRGLSPPGLCPCRAHILDRPPQCAIAHKADDDTEYASRGASRPRLAGSLPSKIERAQGMPGAGWHPRSRVQDALKNAHTSIQVPPEHPGIPCAMVLRLMPCSPWRRIPLASIAGELTVRGTRSGFANLRQLDASHGRQNHTVLPYAASLATNSDQPSAWRPKQ